MDERQTVCRSYHQMVEWEAVCLLLTDDELGLVIAGLGHGADNAGSDKASGRFEELHDRLERERDVTA